MSKTYKIATIPGDGTGPEVVREGLKVLKAAASRGGFKFDLTEFDFGGARYLKTGETLPDTAIGEFRKFDAMFLGAIGHPDVKPGILETGILLKIRFALDQYINLRPVRLYPNVETPLKDKGPEHIDFVLIRENTGGIYTTLELIASRGPAAFYGGEVGDSMIAAMSRGGGIITRQDLLQYRAEWRTPIRAGYRGYTLYSMPPASSGGITVTESLNMLETWDSLPAFGSAAYAHLLGWAYQRAFIDRNSKLADPAFVPVPLDHLTSKSYARTLARTIDLGRKTPTPANGSQITDGVHTTHYSVVDDRGNAVATTTTLNNGYGSAVYLTNVGLFMNDEMDDFATAPGRPNMFGLVQFEANAIAPGKRMLSAMSPTIVLDPRGELLLVVGAAGGSRIITATSQVILNVSSPWSARNTTSASW